MKPFTRSKSRHGAHIAEKNAKKKNKQPRTSAAAD